MSAETKIQCWILWTAVTDVVSVHVGAGNHTWIPGKPASASHFPPAPNQNFLIEQLAVVSFWLSALVFEHMNHK